MHMYREKEKVQDYSLNTAFTCVQTRNMFRLYIVTHRQAEHVDALQTYKVVSRLWYCNVFHSLYMYRVGHKDLPHFEDV